MNDGPYFDKAWQRDQYEEERAKRERELRRHGQIAGPRKLIHKPDPPPEFLRSIRERKDEVIVPLNYTPEERAERQRRLDALRPFREFHLDNGNFITGFRS